jgi:hypothetical protein
MNGFDPTDVEDAYLIDSNPDDFAVEERRIAQRTIDDFEAVG